VVAGLTVCQMAHAYGIVASQAAGIQAFIDDGAWTKRIHAGWAAHGAVVAAFRRIGWEWGGSWSSGTDYQHFAVPRRSLEGLRRP